MYSIHVHVEYTECLYMYMFEVKVVLCVRSRGGMWC